MERSEILEKLVAVAVDQLGLDADAVVEDADFTSDMGLDSLDLLELITTLEDEFGVTIPDEDFEKLHTVADVMDELVGLGL